MWKQRAPTSRSSPLPEGPRGRGLLPSRQRENVNRVSASRRMNVGRNGGRHLARASSAITGGNRDVLLAIDAVRDRKTLNRGSEARVEKHLARVHIDGFEMAVQASRKYDAAGG